MVPPKSTTLKQQHSSEKMAEQKFDFSGIQIKNNANIGPSTGNTINQYGGSSGNENQTDKANENKKLEEENKKLKKELETYDTRGYGDIK